MLQTLLVSSKFLGHCIAKISSKGLLELVESSGPFFLLLNAARSLRRDFICYLRDERNNSRHLSQDIRGINYYLRNDRESLAHTCHVFSLKTLAAGGVNSMCTSWCVVRLPLVIFILPVPMPPSAEHVACSCNHR